MKNNSLNKLLIKNGFRVFWKTKGLATQLTILTTLAATGLTATVLTNYNLDMSKKAIIDQGNAFDFSISTSLNNDVPVSLEPINLDETNVQLQPPYTKHLGNQNIHDFPVKTIGGYQTRPGVTVWKNAIPNDQQKLVYYFATQPTPDGSNLLRIKKYSDDLFSSLTNLAPEIRTQILNQASEFFSFSAGDKPQNQGIPFVTKQGFGGPQIFDVQDILVDEHDNVIGTPTFGKVQATGFNPTTSMSINHNIVNVDNVNQDDFNVFRASNDNYTTPNTVTIYFGDQAKYLDNYAKDVADMYRRTYTSPETERNNLEIFLSIGESFNTLASQPDNIVAANWVPYLIKLDPQKMRGSDLFAYQTLFANNGTQQDFKQYYELLKQEDATLPSQRLDAKDVTLANLTTLQSQYPFLKYFETVLWVPEQLIQDNKLPTELVNASKLWYDQAHSYLANFVSPKYKCNDWQNESAKVLKYVDSLVNNGSLTNNQRFEMLINQINIDSFYTFIKADLINYLNEHQNGFLTSLKTSHDPALAWNQFVSQALTNALQASWLSPAYYYNSWYTTEGLLQTLGLNYRHSNDFTTQIDNQGISYTYSKIQPDATVNNVVSNQPIDWRYFEPSLTIDTNEIYTLTNDILDLQWSVYHNNTVLLDRYNYDWFKRVKPYRLYRVLATMCVYDGTTKQTNDIIEVSSKLAALDETMIHNEQDFENVWVPTYLKQREVFRFIAPTVKNNICTINLGCLIGFGQGATISVNANVLDKSAFVALVSESYLSSNVYSANNTNGKMVYTDYAAFQKARQLPFMLPLDLSTQGIPSTVQPSSPNWIFNQETGQWKYYNDFFSWLTDVDAKYKMNVNDEDILIVGSGISPEFIYPTQNANNLLVNPKNAPVLYANTYGYDYALNNNEGVSASSYYAIKKDKMNERNAFYKKYLGLFNPVPKLNNLLERNITNNNSGLAYLADDPNQPNRLLYTRANFSNIVQQGLLIASVVLSLILLILTAVFVCTLIRSIVKQNKKTFGITISNGVQKKQLVKMMFPFALIPGVIAGVLGYWFATLLQPLILNSISSYWCLPVTYNYYIWWLFLLIPLAIVGLLYLVNYFVVMWTLRKNVTELLTSSVSFRMNALVENSKWMTRKMRPTHAFKVTYMLGNVTRFLTLVGVITTFVTLSTTTIGTLNTFTTALDYTQKNKNYNYGTDLISPTISGGWYYTMPFSQIGTTQQGIGNTLNNQDFDNDTNYQSIGSVNNSAILGKTNITANEITLKLWLAAQLPSYQYGTKSSVALSGETLSRFIDNNSLNLTSLTGQLQTFDGYNFMCFTPEKASLNGTPNIDVANPQPLYVDYEGVSNTYAPKDFKQTWNDPYDSDLKFTSSYFLSFKIAKQYLGDLQFFKNNAFTQLGLDIDFDLGGMQVNPWSVSKNILPKVLVSSSIESTKITVQRLIGFYTYLDQVAAGHIQPVDPILTYENYYGQMQTNRPDNIHSYNPINIDGRPLALDKDNMPVLNKNYSLLTSVQDFNGKRNYLFNQDIAIAHLPDIQWKPETVRLYVYLLTNPQNKVYQTWLNKVAKVDTTTQGYDSIYKLAPNIVALSDDYNNSHVIENTYTYVTGRLYHGTDNQVLLNNAKIIGLNQLDHPDKASVLLYDSHNQVMNSQLKEVLPDGSYPLIVNEVMARLYNLKVGDHLAITPDNGLFRYIDKFNQDVNTQLYPFTIVGITTSKSEQQMYTNQAFANHMLQYDSDRLGAKGSYQDLTDANGQPLNYVPFNGFYTNNPNSPMVNSFVSMYSITGMSPIHPTLLLNQNGSIVNNDCRDTISICLSKLNGILKFDFYEASQSMDQVVTNLIKLFGNGSNSLTLINPTICGVDAKFATSLVGSTIDTTLTNIQTIILVSLLPTLLIIICLMATMIVTESRRLIAIMKVLGIGDWKNTFNFLFIYFIVLLLGLLIAIPLTYGILALISNITFSLFNIIINPVAPWWIYLATVGGLLIIFSVMFSVVKEKMSKINLPQAINFEN